MGTSLGTVTMGTARPSSTNGSKGLSPTILETKSSTNVYVRETTVTGTAVPLVTTISSRHSCA